ncbi:MAG: ABC transporter ATP-binding protein [Eubacteriales bacterium]|nr:ABC transporter ATP-binding protein [Eubacteriales bacterium]
MKKKHEKAELIFRFLKGSKKYFAMAVAASFITTILNALIPQIFRFTVDSVLEGKEHRWLSEHLWTIAGFLICVAILSGAALFVSRLYTAKAGENFAKNMRDSLFTHVQRLPVKWHDRHQTGDIIQRCTSDVEVIRNFVVTQLLEVFRTVFLIAVSFSIMLSMNVKLSMLVLIFVPVVAAYSVIFYRLIAKKFTWADEAEGELSTVVQENATGVRVVRAFGREMFEMERFHEKNNAFANLWIKLGTMSGLYWGTGDFITGLQVIAVIVFGAIEAVHGELSVGEFIAFASYNTTLVWPVRGLGRILSEMSKAGVSFERVNYILAASEEEYGEEKETKTEDERSCEEQFDIEFAHVDFGYNKEKKVLDDVTFTIPQGTTLGILGGTGSGKSTVIQLLNRLYELSEGNGKITIGGRDIREIPLKELRKKIGIVLQEPFLYSRTIRENICASRPDATFEEIREAAKIACVDEAIMNFPDGYETLVGERGVTLSGGQRQRVAIARMLLQKAPIMIFDDSLSAVDSQTDSKIRKELAVKCKDATVILISHRITTLMGADNIMVLNCGRIEEMGTHQELLDKHGSYKEIYEIQMSQDDRMQVEG